MDHERRLVATKSTITMRLTAVLPATISCCPIVFLL
jgi:hypothetical protein